MDAEWLMRCFIAGPDALRKFVGPGPFTRDAQPMLEYAVEASLITGNQHPTRQMIAALCESAAPLLANAPADLVLRLARRAAVNRDLNRIMVEGDAGNDGSPTRRSRGCSRLVDESDDAGLRDSVAGILAEAAHDKFYALDFPVRRGPAAAARPSRSSEQASEFRAPRLPLDAATRLAPEHPVVLRDQAKLLAMTGSIDARARAPRAERSDRVAGARAALEQARILALGERLRTTRLRWSRARSWRAGPAIHRGVGDPRAGVGDRGRPGTPRSRPGTRCSR
jgi:hypothetical protein